MVPSSIRSLAGFWGSRAASSRAVANSARVVRIGSSLCLVRSGRYPLHLFPLQRFLEAGR
eukprot:477721-Alexandrium_andersonii.AAC.1